MKSKLGIYLSFLSPLLLFLRKSFRIRKVLENKSNTEEDRVAIVEAQLAQAKLIAEEADRKYEEVKWKNHENLFFREINIQFHEKTQNNNKQPLFHRSSLISSIIFLLHFLIIVTLFPVSDKFYLTQSLIIHYLELGTVLL